MITSNCPSDGSPSESVAYFAISGMLARRRLSKRRGPSPSTSSANGLKRDGLPLVSSRDFIGLGRYGLAAFPCFAVWGAALGAWTATRGGEPTRQDA